MLAVGKGMRVIATLQRAMSGAISENPLRYRLTLRETSEASDDHNSYVSVTESDRARSGNTQKVGKRSSTAEATMGRGSAEAMIGAFRRAAISFSRSGSRTRPVHAPWRSHTAEHAMHVSRREPPEATATST